MLRRNRRDAGALHLLGLIARRKGRAERAVQLLTRAAEIAPEDGPILCDLGNACKAAGRLEEAIAFHGRVAELMPDSPEALSNLGSALNAAGRAEDAVDCFRRAAAAGAGNAEIHYNLGNGLLAAGDAAAAADAFRRATAIDPAHLRARTNLGVAIKEQGRLEEAVAAFEAAIRLAPDHADAHWNLSLALIMAGRYADGWREYEWRRRIPGFAMRAVKGADWTGGRYPGKTLLVHAEQGLGDAIQFARYLPMAEDADGRLVFVCPQPVKALFAGLDGDFELCGGDESLPRCDLQAPLMSLPHLLEVAEPVWPVSGPYLRAPAKRLKQWRERLGGNGGLKVGICWQGRPQYAADRRRSVPLAAFAALAHRDGVRLFSLQKGFGAEQLAEQGWRDRVFDPGAAFDADGAFLDSAAAIAALDLVITSDTAIAHLAGALGADVWLLLAHVPDWRWGIAGGRTPWYPTMRLFRQDRPGDWDAVMRAVVGEVEALKHG